MINLLEIQERHNQLYDAFLRNSPELKSSRYRHQLKGLLNDIKELSPKVPSVQDFFSLSAAVDQWRKAGPALGIDVTNVILTPPPSEKLTHAPASEQPVWPDSSLAKLLGSRANEFSKYRAVRWREETMSLDDLVEFHRSRISADEAARNKDEDWLQAQLYWALAVLKGEFDFVRSLSPASYHRLEGENGRMWLSEVKKLQAYLNWEARGRGWGIQEANRDYESACQDLRKNLLDPRRKAPQSAFEPVEKHIEQHFLSSVGALDISKDETKRWLEAKSQRLLETRAAENLRDAKTAAEDQMKKFYQNITKAVLGVREENTRLVAEALGLCPKFQHYEASVNCFEMAIAIYFLDSEISKKLLGD